MHACLTGAYKCLCCVNIINLVVSFRSPRHLLFSLMSLFQPCIVKFLYIWQIKNEWMNEWMLTLGFTSHIVWTRIMRHEHFHNKFSLIQFAFIPAHTCQMHTQVPPSRNFIRGGSPTGANLSPFYKPFLTETRCPFTSLA